MPKCYEDKKYNFTENCHGDMDLYIEYNCNKLKVIVNKKGLIDIYHENIHGNKTKKDKYHLQKGNMSSWYRVIEWISDLHNPESCNENRERRKKYKNKQKKFLDIFDIFDKIKDDSYKEFIK